MNDMNDKNYSADLFSEEQVTAEMASLPEYERIEAVAMLTAGNYDPVVLEIFAKLARAIGSGINTTGYSGNMRIERELPLKDRRASAIQRLQNKAERGEIVPAFAEIDKDPEDAELSRIESSACDS